MVERGRRLRVFISSPADVRPERVIAQRVVARLDHEFAAHFAVDPILWEREPLIATEHFQTLITPPHDTDIVVVILWSRLGVPLPNDKPGPLTGRRVTGTEWEFEDAVASYRARKQPDLLFYRKQAEVSSSLSDRAEIQRRFEQIDLVEDFMRRWFRDEATGGFTAASWSFNTAGELEEMLETHLRDLLARRIAGATLKSESRWHQGSPFRGLQSFELEHAPVFFGRTRARNELRELLARQDAAGCAFVLVLGGSGSGKSSVVKAGLLSDLLLPGMIGKVALCRYALLRPGDRPNDLVGGVAAALMGPTALPELAELQYDTASLAALLRGPSSQVALPIRQGLAKAAEGARLTRVAEARVLLVIDQLEELFTLDGLAATDREGFVAALEGLARSGLVWVVATMRSDFFDRLEHSSALARLPAEARYLLHPPDEAEIGQIVRQPAREAGLRFEIDGQRGLGLDEVITAAAARHPTALPLLEFTLHQLWQQRQDGALTFAAYEALGGLEGALGRRAEEEFANLPVEVQAALPSVLRALVTVAQGIRGTVTARPAPLVGFAAGSPQRRLVDAFLAPQARLLVADGDGEGARVRVAHEALLTHWERATRQIAADRIDLQLRARLEQASVTWRAASAAEQDGRLLPAGLPLSEAEDLLARRGDELETELKEYIGRSTAAARAQARNRLRRLQVVTSIVSLLAVLAGVFAWFAYKGEQKAQERLHAAQITESRFLADRARQEADQGRARLGILLALEALPADTGDNKARPYVLEAEAALYHTLQQPYDQSVLQSEHPVLATAFSPDGTRVATLALNGTLRVWDAASGAPVWTLHEGPANVGAAGGVSVAFNRDGTRLLSRWSYTATLWDPVAGKEVAGLGKLVYSAAFSPDGSRVVTGKQIWDATSGRWLRDLLQHEDRVESATFGPDGTHIVSVSADNKVRLCDSDTGAERAVLDPPGYSVDSAVFGRDGTQVLIAARERVSSNGGQAVSQQVVLVWDTGSPVKDAISRQQKLLGTLLAFSPDGSRVITTGDKGTATLFHLASQQETPLSGHASPVKFATFSPDGTRFITASDDTTARLYDITGNELATLRGHDGRVRSATLGPDGEHIITGDSGAARLWTLSRAIQMSTLRRDKEQCPAVAVHPDAQHAVTACSDGVHVWDVASGKYVASLPGYAAETRFAAFSPKGNRIVTGSSDGEVRIWDAARYRELAVIGGKNGHHYALEFSRDGTRILSAIWHADTTTTIRAWDASSLSPILPVSGLTRRGRSARFSPDGTKVIILSDNEPVRLEDLGDRNRAAIELGPNDVKTAQFSPDGRLVAAGRDDGSVQLWDVASGKPIDSWPVHASWMFSLTFSRDGRRIVTGSMDWAAGLSDTELRKRTTVLAGHKERVRNAVFNADGSRIATTSGDATMRLWDGATGKELVVLDMRHWFKRPVPAIVTMSLAADNRTIATLGSDGVARLWYVFPSTQALIAYAQTIVQHQQLTADDRRRFFLNDSPPK